MYPILPHDVNSPVHPVSAIDYMPVEQLRALQLHRLQWTVKYAYERVPLFRKRCDEKGVKPESVYVAPFAQNRYLEIARGNDESEFGRRACLDLNEEIIEIAIAGEGLALYWTHDGLKVLARTEEN